MRAPARPARLSARRGSLTEGDNPFAHIATLPNDRGERRGRPVILTDRERLGSYDRHASTLFHAPTDQLRTGVGQGRDASDGGHQSEARRANRRLTVPQVGDKIAA